MDFTYSCAHKSSATILRVPWGVDLKYVSSCKYDSSSKEISSDSELRKSMSKEARIDESQSYSVQAGFKTLIYDFSASVSTSHSFSQSTKFSSSSDTSKSERSVSFESKAICSEFEASFIPAYQHQLDPEFEKVLSNLPVPCEFGYSGNTMSYVFFSAI